MKTLRLVMIVTVVSFAMMSIAENSTQQVEKVNIIKITLEQAQADLALVCAMYKQLTPALLMVADKQGFYSGRVTYNHRVFEIYGTREAWVKFFRYKTGWGPITDQD